MSQKKHLDLLCFIFPKSKRCSVHLFVKNKNIDKFDKIQELPTYSDSFDIPPLPTYNYYLIYDCLEFYYMSLYY